MSLQRNVRCVHVTNVACGKQISITYSECVSVALVIQHAKRKHSIVLSSVACPALPHFSRFSHKRHDFRGKKKICIKCLLWFSLQNLSETFLILWRNEWDITRNVHRSSCKWSFLLVRFEQNLNFLHRFAKNPQISNLMKICPVGSQFFHAGAQTWAVRHAKHIGKRAMTRPIAIFS